MSEKKYNINGVHFTPYMQNRIIEELEDIQKRINNLYIMCLHNPSGEIRKVKE